MAKRFTDTEKWKRPWFDSLSVTAKLVWIYLLDDCDYRGVWVANFRRLSSDVGVPVTREEFESWFGEKLIRIEDDKYFLSSFVEFQYGEDLNPNNKVHRGILNLLDKYRDKMSHEKEGACKGLPSPMQGAKEKDKDKDKDFVFVLEGSTRKVETEQITSELVTKCCETWVATLKHFGIERTILPSEQIEIGRAIQTHGVEAVDLALYGARHEPKVDNFDPKNFVSLARIFGRDKSGKLRIDRFVNYASQNKTAQAQKVREWA